MRQNLDRKVLDKIRYLIGDESLLGNIPEVSAKEPFSKEVIEFLDAVSKRLMKSQEAKAYPDVVTLGFWLRRASLMKLKERFAFQDRGFHVGRGVAFHIAPSNVAVNYAYSLAAGLLTGNANVVRLPSKDFPQVELINWAIKDTLKEHEAMRPYLVLIRYGREKEINDFLSSIADIRIIWGGDQTIEEIRKSPLRPRAGEITFADRFSIAVINSQAYLKIENKGRTAEDFYNDTYLTDQNACTSPRVVVWTGREREQAKEVFWKTLYGIVKEKYLFQPIVGVNKLTSACLAAVSQPGVKVEPHVDNRIIRVKVKELTGELMDLRDNSGYFFEYDCEDILELKALCNDKRCQTAAYIGEPGMFQPLLEAGIKGLDQIVPVGHTMEFDLIWDGYNLVERMTRGIRGLI